MRFLFDPKSAVFGLTISISGASGLTFRLKDLSGFAFRVHNLNIWTAVGILTPDFLFTQYRFSFTGLRSSFCL